MTGLTNNKSLQQWLQFSPWLLAAGLLFWWSSFGFLGLGIDQEYALFRVDQRGWLSQGRWFNFLFTQYIYPQPVLVYFPHLLFVMSMAASYLIVLQAFAVPFAQRWWALLAFPVFMAHPVWYFIAEFAANLTPIALSMVAIATAVWLFAQCLNRPLTAPNVGLQVALLCIALGSYQSLLFVAYVLYAGRVLWHYYQCAAPLSRRTLLKPLVLLAGIMAASLVVNSLLLRLLFVLFHTQPDYLDNHVHLGYWLEQSQFALRSYVNILFNFYAGSSHAYLSTLFASGVIMLWALLLFFWQNRRQPLGTQLLLWLVVISVVTVPFITQVLVVRWQAPHRTFLALASTLWLATFYLLLRLQHTRYQLLALLLVLLLNVQLLHLHARYDSAKLLLYEHDRQVALQLYERILQLMPDYQPQHRHLLSVQGALAYEPPYGELPSTLLSGSFFSWDGGNAQRIAAYMRSQNYRGLEAVSPQQEAALQPIYQSMPPWPAQGAVRLEEGVILVKLGTSN